MVAWRFPELEEVIVEWEALASGEAHPPVSGPFGRSVRLPGSGVEPVLPCPNPRCQDGGFEVAFVVESMISERAEERTGVLVCIGWEGGTGARGWIPCTGAIGYRIRLAYAKAGSRLGGAQSNGDAGR
jgi:hypothetical protein